MLPMGTAGEVGSAPHLGFTSTHNAGLTSPAGAVAAAVIRLQPYLPSWACALTNTWAKRGLCTSEQAMHASVGNL